MAEITNIACRRLHPHPDNPRKELGDLTELAASIRENGIFQNLTVIPGHYMTAEEYADSVAADGGSRQSAMAVWNPKIMWSSDDYTIIIGHRRAAAAQQAGLFEVPCVVVEMDEREQLQTMMIENMQRTDLTTYEQAQGFQLMLDLGDTVEQVASKSGFSQSTIRRRVKLLSLDRDAFRRAELRGATLSDYAELDKIESVEDKNKALEALGTQNFRRVMQEVLENQKWEHRKAEWIADLKKFAIEDPNATYQTHEHVTGYSKWNITKDVVVPEDADHVQYFYKVSSGQIDLYKTRDVAAEDAEKAKRDAAREEERMIGESFHNITELMKKGLKTMNEKTMGAIPVSALERLEQSAVKLSLITFCLRHEELKAAPDAAEIHSIKSDLSRALREVSTNAAACALTGGIPEKAKASTPAGAEPKRVQRKEIHKGTAYGVLRLRCPKCGDVFGRFLREPSASVTCRCGGEVQLDNLTRYEFTCPCCDFEARGRTNLEDPEITVPCKCGNPVTMKWDRNKRMYHE